MWHVAWNGYGIVHAFELTSAAPSNPQLFG